MKVLVVGSGAREHAICWKLSQSPLCEQVYVWPGNPAICQSFRSFDLQPNASFEDLARHCLALNIGLIVPGPEGPLAAGVADTLEAHGLLVFGPNRYLSQLESSKVFAKNLMAKARIPTAHFTIARSAEECARLARAQLLKLGSVVLKASGLAGGKGVFVCRTEAELKDGLARLYHSSLSTASDEVVIEEMLVGREVSHFSLISRDQVVSLGFAVDFKRLLDRDLGPNTGGMGSYTPVPWLPENADQCVHDQILSPLMSRLRKEGHAYQGFLYTGIMWHESGPKVIEFNVRLGDPEAQVLAVSDQRDWLAAILSILESKSQSTFPAAKRGDFRPAVAVVLASEGYPFPDPNQQPESAQLSLDLRNHSRSHALFAGDLRLTHDHDWQTGSGRVLTVVHQGSDHAAARQLAYNNVENITKNWPKSVFRRDIADNC